MIIFILKIAIIYNNFYKTRLTKNFNLIFFNDLLINFFYINLKTIRNFIF